VILMSVVSPSLASQSCLSTYPPGCHCHMDSCLEAARLTHLQQEIEEAEAARLATTEATTASKGPTTTLEDATTTEPVTTTTPLGGLEHLLRGSGLRAREPEVRAGSRGIHLEGFNARLCDCSDRLPETIAVEVIISNRFWNPAFGDQKSALWKETQRVVSTEVQLLLSSTKARLAHDGLWQGVKATRFSSYFGLVKAFLNVNLTESHFDNHIQLQDQLRESLTKYRTFEGQGVFGNKFRGFSKGDYDMDSISTRRLEPVQSIFTVTSSTVKKEVDHSDAVDATRMLTAGIGLVLLIFSCAICARISRFALWC